MSEQMPMEEAWEYYQGLLQQQRDVLDSKAHIDALEKHIGSFPALERITITAATHGRLYNPLYETPMIRAFPRGFNHYIPRGWPIIRRVFPNATTGTKMAATGRASGSNIYCRYLLPNQIFSSNKITMGDRASL